MSRTTRKTAEPADNLKCNECAWQRETWPQKTLLSTRRYATSCRGPTTTPVRRAHANAWAHDYLFLFFSTNKLAATRSSEDEVDPRYFCETMANEPNYHELWQRTTTNYGKQIPKKGERSRKPNYNTEMGAMMIIRHKREYWVLRTSRMSFNAC